MKVQRFVLLLLLVTILSVFGGVSEAQERPSGAGTFGESDALNTVQQWASLISNSDLAGLEQLLNDKYMHIHANSVVESKALFIEALKNGLRRYGPIKIEEVKVQVFDHFAVVTGKFNQKIFSRMRTLEGIYRFGLVLVKTKQGIQVVSFQATAIPQHK
jgi:hypothetical protein